MRGLSLLRFRRLLLSLGILGALLGLGAAPTPEAPPSEGVQVPVVLDGVRYEPEEFNRMEADLRRRGIVLCFTVARDGTLHAFSSYLPGCHEFLEREWRLSGPLVYPPPIYPLRIRTGEGKVKGVGVWVEPIIGPSSSDS